MKYLILLLITSVCFADIKISNLPLANPADVGVLDSFPFVSNSSHATYRLKISDLLSVPFYNPVSPANGGTGIANNALSTLTITGSFPLAFTVGASTSLTLPASGSVATLAGIQTFTNKTLTSPTINAAALSGTLSGTPTFSGNLTSSAGIKYTVATAGNDEMLTQNSDAATVATSTRITHNPQYTGSTRINTAQITLERTSTVDGDYNGVVRIRTRATSGALTDTIVANADSSTTLAGKLVASTGGVQTKLSTANTSNPPTNAELISAFGAAATVGAGFIGIVDDNAGHTNEYVIWSDGTKYWYLTGTAAP